jgi:hypothetical protein
VGVPAGVQSSQFETLEDVMDLARSIVNDMFPGSNGAHGRILTDSAPFTINYINSAFRTIQRKLRNEGCTAPIIDGFLIEGLPPVVQADPSIFVSIGQNGYNNGTTVYGSLKLPSDCFNVQQVRQRQTGSNLQFATMMAANDGLASGYQNQWLGMWEWRNYQIFMNGSLQKQDVMIRYTQGMPPYAVPPADFATTTVYVLDSTDALANHIAWQYAAARGAKQASLDYVKGQRDDAVSDMAEEQIRQKQNVNARRPSYQGGGSDNTTNTSLGSTGTVS